MLPLTPTVHPLVRSALAEPGLFSPLVDALGSPLNVLFPQIASENADALAEACRVRGVTARVHFAHKANKSRCVVRQLAAEGHRIDVSSERELCAALSAGFTPDRIEATGPKSDAFLLLLIQHGVLVSLDSEDETTRLLALRSRAGLRAATPILLRVSGFADASTAAQLRDSRFGVPVARVDNLLRSLSERREEWDLRGFAFHLDTVSIREKALALEAAIGLCEGARSYGFQPSIVNAGGGLRVSYLEHEEEWQAYLKALQDAALGRREPLTWNGISMGWRSEKGVLRGAQNFYDYYARPAGSSYLGELLDTPLEGLEGLPAGTALAERMLTLMLEPGRALLDQAGITLGRVSFRKTSVKGETLVGVEMNKNNLWSSEQEILVDPLLLPKDGASRTPTDGGLYLVGNLCLENDLLFRHKVFLGALPEPGDLLAFVNTAGYYMDFAESSSIQHPVAAKVAVVRDRRGFRWFADDLYRPQIHLQS